MVRGSPLTLKRHMETGEDLKEALLSQDPRYGGRQAVVIGIPGSGKTTLLLKLAEKLIERGEIVIWRGREEDNFNYLPNWEERVKIFHYEKDEIHIYRAKIGSKKAEEITDQLDIETYSSVEDLLEKLDPNKLNVVYEPSFYTLSEDTIIYIRQKARTKIPKSMQKSAYGILFWYELFAKLLRRKDRRWISIIIDEVDDIFPANAKGILWKLMEWVKNSIKDFRKSLVTLIVAVHNLEDVDFRVIRKLPIRIYLQGATVPKKDSLMTDKKIGLKLNPGEAKIEWKGKGYGGFGFAPYPPVEYSLIVEIKWTAEVPEEEEEEAGTADYIRELIDIAEEGGLKKALKRAQEMVKEGKFSLRYYYMIKSMLKEMFEED